MLPFFEQPSVAIGPVTVHGFGVMVCLGILVGRRVAEHRFRVAGLDRGIGLQLVLWALVGGLLGSHLHAVLAYHPDTLATDPRRLLRVWEGMSGFGGLAGGVVGMALFQRLRRPSWDWATGTRYADCLAFAFPFAWVFGRLGCTIAHDHPGVVTRFPLSVSLETPEAQGFIRHVYAQAGLAGQLPPDDTLRALGFFDLGLLELAYTLLVIVPVFVLAGQRQRPAGFFVASFFILYIPVRFGLDFLRVGDVVYAGLTPAQWTAVPLFLGSLLMARRVAR